MVICNAGTIGNIDADCKMLSSINSLIKLFRNREKIRHKVGMSVSDIMHFLFRIIKTNPMIKTHLGT